ncbi:MAPEG family protein [Falsirhodobacter algicola]|uniref:MAPEG family protein n=1 Tax=Falsirhodobacter algicola TaxID=2692330 RepID=A0A8J8MQK1_9RHOB|nr:MAPEG family protein [Falsirhodobacter algicola]QUS34862.1 MAPEG family protein [Falsirhodobacter algicola]
MAEIVVLCLAALLYVGVTLFTSRLQDRDMGPEYNLSPRDGEPSYSTQTQRMQRAMRNHLDNFVLFAAAALAVFVTRNDFWLTDLAAWIYLLARIAYVPAYYYGWAPWRSIFFMCGLVATIVMYLVVLF